MADLYTYDLVAVTPLLQASVTHLLSVGPEYSVSENVLAELKKWDKNGVDIQPNVELVSNNEVKAIPFELVKRIQEQLQIAPQSQHNVEIFSLCD